MLVVGCQAFAHAPDWIERWQMLRTQAGGRVYGTSVAGSDLDYRIVFVQPPEYIYGIDRYDMHGPDNAGSVDLCCYSLQQFARMCLMYNPHLLEILWTPLDMHERCDTAWRMIYDLRASFLSKSMVEPFCAYARVYLERAVAGAKDFGWSPSKNAMHAVRVLRMGLEAVAEGEIRVIRPDADYLLAIRRGKESVDDARRECERLESAIREAIFASVLPDKPNRVLINRAVVSISRIVLQSRG